MDSGGGDNTSPLTQYMFPLLACMLLCRYDDIRWEGSDIVVLGDVRISPPYATENCTGSSTAVSHIQKLVS